MSNWYAVELAKCRPLPDGGAGYYDAYGGGVTMSAEGLASMRLAVRLYEQHADALEAWMQVYGLTQCEHSRPLTDLSWSINDYIDYISDVSEPESLIFWLSGFHDAPDGSLGPFCAPWGYHAAGVFFPW